MNGTPINSSQNPNFLLQQKIQSSKKHRRKEGLIWIEGQRALSQCPKSKIKAVFCGPNAPKADWPLAPYELSPELAAKCFETDNPQEVGALLHWKAVELENCDFSKGLLILDGLQDPGNAGSLLRTAAALDMGGLVLLNSVEAGNSKLIRSSAGSILSLPICEINDRQQLQQQLKDNNCQIYMADAGGKTEEISKPTANFAIVIGSEAHGLGDGWQGYIWSLKLANNIESLNASVAGALLMSELKR
jgi:TrmH family RNA methyltransferase